jgi:uncharacterized protein YndB with AHSA1/START domain
METSNNVGFEVSHVFPVSQAKLFKAFIDANTLKQIWGVSSISVDARPGGHARAELSFENESWDFTISYQDVMPHHTLRWIVHFDRFPNKEPQATLLFSAMGSGAEVTVRMKNFETAHERDSNKQAWEGALRKLEEIFAT